MNFNEKIKIEFGIPLIPKLEFFRNSTHLKFGIPLIFISEFRSPKK